MNNLKREKIKEALRCSKRVGQYVSLLKGFEEVLIAEYLENCIYSCKIICSLLQSVLNNEVISHSNVPRNLSRADNSYNMRVAMLNIRQAKEGYLGLLSSLESFRGKCDYEDWSERFDCSIDWESDIESFEKLLKDAM